MFVPLRVRSTLVIAQLGQSLDGRIATEEGDSHYINGPEDLRRLHRLRALVQAVVVGAGTVESDNPRLTVRRVEGENPVRVLLDPRGRVGASSAVFRDGAAPTLVIRADPGPPPEGAGKHVEVATLTTRERGFDPHDVISLLAERGLRRLLIEGGGLTVSRFLERGALDRLHVSVAPLLIGSGRAAITLPPVDSLDQALRPSVRHFRLGNDLLFDLELSRAG